MKSFVNYLMIVLVSMEASAIELQERTHDFGFHGYARGSLATSSARNTAAEFKAPGAGAKYRLGNESDAQLRLRFNYMNKSQLSSDPYFKAVLAIEDYQRLGNSRDFHLSQVPKAWMQIGNLFDKGISVWAGRRWYERKGTYLNDYWWLNSGQKSHTGIGVEGIDIASSSLNIAVFRHLDKRVSGIGVASNSKGTVQSTTLDARLKNIILTESVSLNFWGIYAARDEQSDLNYQKKNGWGIGAWLNHNDFSGGSNTLAVTYRTRAALHQGTYNARPIIESKGYNLDKASQWEINNGWLWDDRSNYALQWVALLRRENFGVSGDKGSAITWFSVGARPMFYLSEHWNIVTDIGVDRVDNRLLGVKGQVAKTSAAFQFSQSKGFMSRPALRFFLTYARWSNSLKGFVGNFPERAPYGDNNDGWTIGTQIEHIW